MCVYEIYICTHADSVRDSVVCLLPEQLKSRFGSSVKIVHGKQILIFAINWEGNNSPNSKLSGRQQGCESLRESKFNVKVAFV